MLVQYLPALQSLEDRELYPHIVESITEAEDADGAYEEYRFSVGLALLTEEEERVAFTPSPI